MVSVTEDGTNLAHRWLRGVAGKVSGPVSHLACASIARHRGTQLRLSPRSEARNLVGLCNSDEYQAMPSGWPFLTAIFASKNRVRNSSSGEANGGSTRLTRSRSHMTS